LVLGSWLLASGVSGTFGVLASNAGAVANQALQSGQVNVPGNVTPPNVSAEDARNIAAGIARTNWWFAFGSLLSLIAALVGATVGTRSPRARA
ncbi:MAG TPA: hypothetical protein V6D03_16155, partial [Candidatus Caenarcaniphilales bacterium]